jgi:hypothetical protein
MTQQRTHGYSSMGPPTHPSSHSLSSSLQASLAVVHASDWASESESESEFRKAPIMSMCRGGRKDHNPRGPWVVIWKPDEVGGHL